MQSVAILWEGGGGFDAIYVHVCMKLNNGEIILIWMQIIWGRKGGGEIGEGNPSLF